MSPPHSRHHFTGCELLGDTDVLSNVHILKSDQPIRLFIQYFNTRIGQTIYVSLDKRTEKGQPACILKGTIFRKWGLTSINLAWLIRLTFILAILYNLFSVHLKPFHVERACISKRWPTRGLIDKRIYLNIWICAFQIYRTINYINY